MAYIQKDKANKHNYKSPNKNILQCYPTVKMGILCAASNGKKIIISTRHVLNKFQIGFNLHIGKSSSQYSCTVVVSPMDIDNEYLIQSTWIYNSNTCHDVTDV